MECPARLGVWQFLEFSAGTLLKHIEIEHEAQIHKNSIVLHELFHFQRPTKSMVRGVAMAVLGTSRADEEGGLI